MSLKSTSVIKILDLLCEGPIEGFATKLDSNNLFDSVLLNDQPAKLSGNSNFDTEDVDVSLRLGSANQDVLDEFQEARKTEIISIDEEVGSNYSETLKTNNTVKSRNYGGGKILKKIIDADANKLEIIFTIPALFCQAVEGIASGQLFSAKITIGIFIKSQKKGFKKKADITKVIEGISTSNYQWKTGNIQLDGHPPYTVRIEKITDKENDYEIRREHFEKIPKDTPLENKRANRLICTSFLLKTSSSDNFKNTACVGLQFSSEAFPQLPTRSYLIKGKKVRIFSNAAVRTGSNGTGSLKFSGEFDGNFLQTINEETGEATDSLVWTTCPVCIFLDMLTNTTYGAGDFVSIDNISLVDLYPIAQYCNDLVDIPDGKQEARFAVNTVIGNQTSAYKLLQYLASTFRGMTYWASNTVNVGADHGNLDGFPVDPVHLYNNSNVIGGMFNYSGTSVKTRSTKIRVNYNDPDNNYKVDQIIVQDQDLIDKFGLQEKEIVAFGCTSKHQAQRMGQYMLKSEELDAEIVTFSTGLDGLFVLPSQVFAVADFMRAGQRTGGRVSSATTTVITTDQTVQLPAGSDEELTCILADGTLETREISNSSGTTITVANAFSSAPQAQSVYAISTSSVQKQKFRCINITDNNDGTYTITGVQHNDSIYDAADDTTGTTNLDSDDRLITTFDNTPEKPIDGVVTFLDIKINNQTTTRALFQWSRGTNAEAIKFNLVFSVNDDIKTSLTNYTATTFEYDGLAEGDTVLLTVASVGFLPEKVSSPLKIEQTVTASGTNSSTGTVNISTDVPPDPE
tara:strand:+ start:3181 stop:5574 length:2394 start_codon:yes stop_codon:yes gene_type:complete